MCVCRSANLTPTIAIVAVAVTPVKYVILWCHVQRQRGVYGSSHRRMSNEHSLGDMLINLITAVERHIVVVECVYNRGHQAIGIGFQG